jgi:hypothetical protein
MSGQFNLVFEIVRLFKTLLNADKLPSSNFSRAAMIRNDVFYLAGVDLAFIDNRVY